MASASEIHLVGAADRLAASAQHSGFDLQLYFGTMALPALSSAEDDEGLQDLIYLSITLV